MSCLLKEVAPLTGMKTPFQVEMAKCKFPTVRHPAAEQMYCSTQARFILIPFAPFRGLIYPPSRGGFLSIQQGQEVSLGRGYNQYWLFLKVPSSMRNHHGGVGGVVRICSIEKLVLLVGWKSRGIITSAAVQQLHLKPDKVSGVIARIRWSFRLDQQDQNDQWHPVGHVCQPPGHRPLPPGGPLPLHSGGQDHYYWFNFFHAFRSTTSQTMSNFNVWGYLAR